MRARRQAEVNDLITVKLLQSYIMHPDEGKLKRDRQNYSKAATLIRRVYSRREQKSGKTRSKTNW